MPDAGLEKEVGANRRELEGHVADLGRARLAEQAADDELAAARARFQELGGEIASLEALLQGGTATEAVAAWWKKAGLAAAPRLVDVIQVDAPWSLALETVLGSHLQDRMTGDLDAALRAADKLEQGQVGLLSGGGKRRDLPAPPPPELGETVEQ